MHRVIFFLFCFCMAAGSALSQNQDQPNGAHFGVKGGICFADQKVVCGSEEHIWDVDTKYRTGFDAGVYVENPVCGPRFAVVVEVHYIQKGFVDENTMTSEQGPETVGTWKENYRADYLSVPLLFKWRLPGRRMTPYALLGPRVDFFMRKKVDVKIESETYQPKVPANWEGFYEGITFRQAEFGLTAGMGIEMMLKRGLSALIEVRYDHAFTNSYEPAHWINGGTVQIRNVSFQCLAGIKVAMRGIGIKVKAERDDKDR